MRRFGLGLLVVGMLLAGCAGGTNGPGSDTPRGSPPSGLHDIEYLVTDAARANSITFQNENDDSSQDAGVDLPWHYDMTGIEEGAFLYVSAQNDGGGTITCQILVDGVTAESNDSHGKYAICTASGTL